MCLRGCVAVSRPSLDTIELASATLTKSLPPNKLAAFGDSTMSGITAIQNSRSEQYLHALRTGPSSSAGPAASAAPSQPLRSQPLQGRRNPADTVRAFDEVGLSARAQERERESDAYTHTHARARLHTRTERQRD